MKKLVVYFSRKDENYVNGVIRNLEVGNTEVAANMIQKLTGADIFKIEPIQEYSKDYNKCIAEAQEDQKRNARPELKKYPKSIEEYDEIYLGYPNYWGTMPMAVFTFLEHFNFTGKTIKPFCTHEGSRMGNSLSDIERLCPGARIESGLTIQGGNTKKAKGKIEQWL